MSLNPGTPQKSPLALSKKRRRSILKGKFHRIFNRFENLKNSESLELLKNVLSDMEISYKELENGHTEFIELLNPELEEDLITIDNADKDMDIMYNELCNCRAHVNKITSKQNSEPERVKQKESVKVKKLDAPVFSGEIREFPSFKRDYESIMFPTYGTDPFALKKSLTNEALKTVQGVDNNYEEMWKRLELKYGRPERLTDSILSDICKLKNIPDGDHSCFINTVEIIERCYLDLNRVNMDREMNTTTMISEIEKILPPVQKREWILQKKKHNKFEQFLPLLEFLLEEKTAMEYMQSELCCEQRAKIHHNSESKLPASKEAVDRISNPNLFDDLGI